MSWYRTGLASLAAGSDQVQGSGTQWSANTKTGEGFLAPDGRVYEIKAVANDASLTLASPYLGTDASAAPYSILPTQGYIRSLAVQVAELVALYQAVPDGVAEAAKSLQDTLAAMVRAEDADTRAATSAAAALASQGAAATSEGNAADSATLATQKAAAASDSAAAALASKNAAAQSETNAAGSARAAGDYVASLPATLVTKVAGRYGDVTLQKGDVGLGNVDNTSDANKPISTAQAAGLVAKTADTGAAKVPVGTTAQRDPAPFAGLFRFNVTLNQFEGHNGTAWGAVGGGATGAPGNAVFMLNDQTVTGDFAIPAGKNALSAGPITINNNVVVTIPTGSVWTIA